MALSEFLPRPRRSREQEEQIENKIAELVELMNSFGTPVNQISVSVNDKGINSKINVDN